VDPVAEVAYDIHDIDTLIIESSVAGYLVTVNNIKSNDIGNLGKPRKDAFTVGITKTALYIIFLIQFIGDCIVSNHHVAVSAGISPHIPAITHKDTPFIFFNPLKYNRICRGYATQFAGSCGKGEKT
jgi:hypothetical protein